MAPQGATKTSPYELVLQASCCLAMGDAIKFKESSFAKGFKYQGL
jgi:hypothetical protein